MAKVFIPEPSSRFNLETISDFGELVTMTSKLPALDPSKCGSIIDEEFVKRGFDPQNDLLCMTGHAIILSVALSVAARRFGAVQLLLWNAREEKYERRWYDEDLLPELANDESGYTGS